MCICPPWNKNIAPQKITIPKGEQFSNHIFEANIFLGPFGPRKCLTRLLYCSVFVLNWWFPALKQKAKGCVLHAGCHVSFPKANHLGSLRRWREVGKVGAVGGWARHAAGMQIWLDLPPSHNGILETEGLVPDSRAFNMWCHVDCILGGGVNPKTYYKHSCLWFLIEHPTGQWFAFLWRYVFWVPKKKVTGSSTDQDVLLGRIWQQYFPNHESRLNNNAEICQTKMCTPVN